MKVGIAFLVLGFGLNALGITVEPGRLYEVTPNSGELRFAQVIESDHIYLRYRPIDSRWTWVTPEDFRRILPGSKALGSRIGASASNAKRWFRLDDKQDGYWVLAKDHERPCLLRETGHPGVSDRHCEADGWDRDSELDPNAPTCKLTADANRITEGQGLTVSWKTEGRADGIIVNGMGFSAGSGDLVMQAKHPGKFHVHGEAFGPGGRGLCDLDVDVDAKDKPVDPPNPPGTPTDPPKPPTVAKPSCTIMATPSRVAVGDSLILEIVLEGQVAEASLDGETLDLKVLKRIRTPRVPGTQTALGQVKGPNGTGTCWTQYEVVPR